MRWFKHIQQFAIIVLFIVAGSCLDPYSSPKPGSATNLVIEGFLNNGDGTCTVRLTRVIATGSFDAPPVEENADVQLLRRDGTLSLLPELTPGVYIGSNLEFKDGDSVQLRITTAGNMMYQSTMVPVLTAPPIDSVTWESKRVGLAIKISTHGDKPGLFYYWKYSDTWNHFAAYATGYTFDHGIVVPLPQNENIYECWTTTKSTEVLAGQSSARNDGVFVVADFVVVTIPWESPKLQANYTVEVEQRAISQETFDYLLELKKTENLGTVFDPLPSSAIGNMKCVTNPEEIALGYFFASSTERKRIYLGQLDLHRPVGTRSITGNETCTAISPIANSAMRFPVGLGEYPTVFTFESCVDCRVNSGTNVRPDFWIW